MQDPRNQVPPSPTISSVSSSDLDTEDPSSMTEASHLGHLWDSVSLQPCRCHSELLHNATCHPPSQSHALPAPMQDDTRGSVLLQIRLSLAAVNGGAFAETTMIHRGTGDSKRSSLGEYLEVERRFGDEAVYNYAEAELEGAVARYQDQQPALGERALFADGRVLPPASAEAVIGEVTPMVSALCRFPVSLTGICSGGGG